MTTTSPSFRTYLVTDPLLCAERGLLPTVAAAVRGGVDLVQLRDKQASDAELIATGRALIELLAPTGIPLIVNDRIAVAEAIGAQGVHVGQSDLAAALARERLGPTAIVGVSVQTPDMAAAIDPAVVDYVGVGPVFATGTKPDHSRPLGFEGLARVCAAAPVPVVAIGGLGAEHVAAVLDAGAAGLAVVSAICGAEDVEAAARTFAGAPDPV